MPSGGGSAGGGGGGGGFGGGGGGGGFSSHSSSHSHTYTTTSNDGDSKSGGCVSCCMACLAVIGAVLIVGLVVGLSVGLNVHLSNQDSDDDLSIATDFYSPGDSRQLSLSSFFCDGGVLELSSSSVDAELFLIDSTPSLNDTNNFSVTINSTIDSLGYRFWQYHLHPNSNISVSICTNLLVDVYIIKGNDNANSWVNNPNEDVAEVFQYAPACCPNNLEYSSPISYQVEQEDEYYVIFHNSLSAEIFVNATLNFERTEYSAPLVSTLKSCNVSAQGQCTIGIDYSTGSQDFLVKTSIPERADWEENIRVSLNCDQRGWAYAVVILVPITVVIGIVVAVVLFFVYWCECCTETKSAESDIETSDFNPDPPPSNSGNVDKRDFNPDPPPE